MGETVGLLGRELKLTPEGKFLGLNLGYSSEQHVKLLGDVPKYILPFVNKTEFTKVNLERYKSDGASSSDIRFFTSEMSKVSKAQSKINRLWKDTPFFGNMVNPACKKFKMDITINNNDLAHRYKNFLTVGGKYSLVCIGYGSNEIREKIGSKHKFTEEELLPMYEYNHSDNLNFTPVQVAGRWGCERPISILIRRDGMKRNLANDLVRGIECGHIAIVPVLKDVFGDAGLCIVDMYEYCKKLGAIKV